MSLGARVAVVELRPEIDIEPEPLAEVVRDRDVENDAAASAVERVVDHGASDRHAEADVIARYRYGHGFGGERNERVFLALGAQVHQVRAELDGPAEIDYASRAEHSDVVTIEGKRAPGLDLAGAGLADLGIINVVGAAEPCGHGLGGGCKHDD